MVRASPSLSDDPGIAVIIPLLSDLPEPYTDWTDNADPDWEAGPQFARFGRPEVRKEEGPMSVTVRIPTPLRRITGGASRVDAQGATVREALDNLVRTHPELGERVYDEQGQL